MTTLFLICFLIGVGVSGVSLFASFAHLHGVHFHHHGGGGHVGGHAHASGGHGHHGLFKDGSAWLGHLLNLAAMTVFLACFGGTGLLLDQLTKLPSVLTLVAALATGVAGVTAINRVMNALRERERPLQPLMLAGTIGRITIPIRDNGGTGEIVYTVDGTRRVSGARSDEHRGIAQGTEVVITRYDKGIAYVCEFDRMLEGRQTPQLTP